MTPCTAKPRNRYMPLRLPVSFVSEPLRCLFGCVWGDGWVMTMKSVTLRPRRTQRRGESFVRTRCTTSESLTHPLPTPAGAPQAAVFGLRLALALVGQAAVDSNAPDSPHPATPTQVPRSRLQPKLIHPAAPLHTIHTHIDHTADCRLTLAARAPAGVVWVRAPRPFI